MEKIKFGILDFGLGEADKNSLVRLKEVIDYAMMADELGFSRFWLAEHHLYNRKLAWGCPAAMVPVLAACTSRIRIGTGGILLKIHNSFDIASQFKLWANIYRGRVDLGLANGQSFNDELVKINRAEQVTFDENFSKLMFYLRQEEEMLKKEIVLPPYKGRLPELWSLGASPTGFKRALEHGTHYVRSIFHENADLSPQKEKLLQFKEMFHQQYGHYPKIMLAISGYCSKDENKAKRMASNLNLKPEYHIAGGISYFEDTIRELSQTYGVDEFLFKDIAKDTTDKLNCLELIAETFSFKYHLA